MGIYYFHIRDELGLIEDSDGIDLPDDVAVLMEAIESADEFLRETVAPHQMRLEVVDADGRTVFMTPVQKRSESWGLLDSLSSALESMH